MLHLQILHVHVHVHSVNTSPMCIMFNTNIQSKMAFSSQILYLFVCKIMHNLWKYDSIRVDVHVIICISGNFQGEKMCINFHGENFQCFSNFLKILAKGAKFKWVVFSRLKRPTKFFLPSKSFSIWLFTHENST